MMLSTEMFVLPEMVGSASCEAMLQTETFSTKLQLYVSVFQCTWFFSVHVLLQRAQESTRERFSREIGILY